MAPNALHDERETMSLTVVEMRELVDEYIETREERLAMEKMVKELDEQEKALHAKIIENLRAVGSTTAAGSTHVANMNSKEKPRVADWTKFHAYVRKENAFSLLQRRIGDEAVQERVDAGLILPGIEFFTYRKLSIAKGGK